MYRKRQIPHKLTKYQYTAFDDLVKRDAVTIDTDTHISQLTWIGWWLMWLTYIIG